MGGVDRLSRARRQPAAARGRPDLKQEPAAADLIRSAAADSSRWRP